MWENAFDVNLKSVFQITQCIEDILKRNAPSSIINISSIYGTYAPDLTITKEQKCIIQQVTLQLKRKN